MVLKFLITFFLNWRLYIFILTWIPETMQPILFKSTNACTFQTPMSPVGVMTALNFQGLKRQAGWRGAFLGSGRRMAINGRRSGRSSPIGSGFTSLLSDPSSSPPILPFLFSSANLHHTHNGVLELEPWSPESQLHALLANPNCGQVCFLVANVLAILSLAQIHTTHVNILCSGWTCLQLGGWFSSFNL